MQKETFGIVMLFDQIVKNHNLKKRPADDIGEIRHPFVVKKERLRTIYIPLQVRVVSKIYTQIGTGHRSDEGVITLPIDETIHTHVLARELPDGVAYCQYQHDFLFHEKHMPVTDFNSISVLLSSSSTTHTICINRDKLLFVTAERFN